MLPTITWPLTYFACGILISIFLVRYIDYRLKKQEKEVRFKRWYFPMGLLCGGVYLLVLFYIGFGVDSVLLCLLFSILVAIAGIDWFTFEIPIELNIGILCLGVIKTILDHRNWVEHVIGFFAISFFLLLLYVLSKGRAIGGGDVKLMAVAGLFIGWKNIVLAFFLGCILASAIHVIRMKLSGEKAMLAFGPYLSVGIFIGALWGEKVIQWYLGGFYILR